MSTRSHTYVTRGPVIMGALQPRIEEEDGPDDAQISQAPTASTSNPLQPRRASRSQS